MMTRTEKTDVTKLMKSRNDKTGLNLKLHFECTYLTRRFPHNQLKSPLTYHRNSSQEPSMSPYCHRLHSQIQALDRSTLHSVERFERAPCRLLFCPENKN